MEVRYQVSEEMLRDLSSLDRFQGRWAVDRGVAAGRLEDWAGAARILSVAATCRLSGLRIADAEVAQALSALSDDQAAPASALTRDMRDIVGYARATDRELPAAGQLVDDLYLRSLHATIVTAEAESVPTAWRVHSLEREAFDADGKAIGVIFPTLAARLVEKKTGELLTWLEFELRSGERHPVLVVGVFMLYLLAISPFSRGNGRLARLLSIKLLDRAGYGFLRYTAFEAEIERQRDRYHETFDVARSGIWSGEADLDPWLVFFVDLVSACGKRIGRKLELQRSVTEYPPLQRAILQTVREHGSVDAALLLQATGANRNTLKDNLRKLVQRGVLRRTGQRRGTRYLLGSDAN